MELSSASAIAAAGLAAGSINTVVGSGTLITFPTLLALGYPPVTANVSNNIGLVFGAVSGTWGYREDLRGQGPTLRRLVPMSVTGAVIGALALLALPARAFETVVPVLISLSLILVVFQPRIAAVMARRRAAGPELPADHVHVGPGLALGTAAAGVYGGYFGAAQGVMLVGLLGSLLPESLQRVNAAKNLLAAVVNGVAAVTFLIVRPGAADPLVIALIAGGSILGGAIGARVGRWLPAPALRAVIVVVGMVAIVALLRR